MELNTLYYGDCLEWMEQWADECVDLIYLDPPFNSNANYNILFSNAVDNGEKAQYRAFNDTWHWDAASVERYAAFRDAAARPAHEAVVGLYHVLGESGMLAYITYMAERLEHMRRLLKPTGSIYLHCDPTASHYLKVVMDAVFGKRNFRREIIWNLQTASGYKSAVHGYIRGHDTIFYYVNDRSRFVFNKHYTPHKPEYIARFNKADEDGRRYRSDRPGGRRQYLDETPGVALTSVWSDIMSFQQHSSSKEFLNYPTQKPLALLERIVKASSNEEDVVLDPFCGCGTAIEAAMRLNRRWAGIDISSLAIDLIRNVRLKDPSIPARGMPFDMASARMLAREKPFDFESWAITRLPGFAPNTKKVGDKGIDGRATLAHKPDNIDSRLALAQVKGGRFSLSALRDFIGVLNRDKAAVGCFITLDPVASREARAEAAKCGKASVLGVEYGRLQLWSIRDYFNKKRPDMPVMTNPYTGKVLDQTLNLF